MPCKHAEDVCQDCLEKVETTTEYPSPKFCQHRGGKKEEDSPPLVETAEEEEEQEVSSWRPRWVPKKTSTEKANEIFMATSSLALAGYVAFWNAKFLLKTADIAVVLAKSIFRNLVD